MSSPPGGSASMLPISPAGKQACHQAATNVIASSFSKRSLPPSVEGHCPSAALLATKQRGVRMKRRSWLAGLLALSLAGCASMQQKNVTEVIAGDPDLSTLNKLISDAGLTTTLSGAGPFTVFAPTNAAFKAVPS